MATVRRHGAELESALLAAAWEQLSEQGYASFTMDAVAARAGTSRPVLYRRWPDKHALVRAAIAHAVDGNRLRDPDTGSLRGDTIALMKAANRSRLGVATVLAVHLGGYYQETGTNPDDLRATLRGDRPRIARVVVDRAVARGEIRGPVSDRVVDVPYVLLMQEFLFTLKPVPTAVIEDIVDTVFLPLVT